MKICMYAVRLGGLPIQCPGMVKSLATPLHPMLLLLKDRYTLIEQLDMLASLEYQEQSFEHILKGKE